MLKTACYTETEKNYVFLRGSRDHHLLGGKSVKNLKNKKTVLLIVISLLILLLGGVACFATMLVVIWPMLTRKEKERNLE